MSPTRRSFLKHAILASFSLWIPPSFAEATSRSLARGTPEAEGVSSQGILDFLDEVEREKFELHSLMVLRHGKVIAEGWWEPYGPEFIHTMYSMSKSFTSTTRRYMELTDGFVIDKLHTKVKKQGLGLHTLMVECLMSEIFRSR